MKVFYRDDPDAEKASQGLGAAPYVDDLFGVDSDYWMMSPSEQAALLYLLQNSRPKIAIEIGTRMGGSLQAIARFSQKVYALDIDPEVPARLGGKHGNVEFLIGSSAETLPPLIDKLNREGAELGFVLVDGDHSAEGVRRDIDNLLNFRPNVPLNIIMHDSFNPECRRGLQLANWAANPHVHAVELDFVAGAVNPSPAFRGQQWGGLALAICLQTPREGHFEVTGRAQLTFDMLQHENIFQKLKYRATRLLRRGSTLLKKP